MNYKEEYEELARRKLKALSIIDDYCDMDLPPAQYRWIIDEVLSALMTHEERLYSHWNFNDWTDALEQPEYNPWDFYWNE